MSGPIDATVAGVRGEDRLLRLQDTEIDLWCTPFAGIEEPELLEAYRTLLDESELEQEKRFHFLHDQRRHLITRALVRTVLSRYHPIPATQWQFQRNPFGRPEIVNPLPQRRQLIFNVSHTRSLIVVGVSRGVSLGIDVENLKGGGASLRIAERFFAAEETARLKDAAPSARAGLFWDYWTLKESYIKARGMGLSLPLDKCSFSFPGADWLDVALDGNIADGTRWDFWQLRAADDYLIAVCASREDSRKSLHRTQLLIPLVRQESMNMTVIRRSRTVRFD